MTDPRQYYENDVILRQYLEFHYGPEYFSVANYPAVCAQQCLDALRRVHGENISALRALELGCAVGRTAFELAADLAEVKAVDLSEAFIATARLIQREGGMRYSIDRLGELQDERQILLQTLGLQQAAARVHFEVGDACRFESDRPYDLVFAGNLIDRLQDPAAFLAGAARLLTPGGLLVLSSPYTLLEEFTPRKNWLGGFQRDGREVAVLESIESVLGKNGLRPFSPPLDIPFVIRETARKHQHTVAEISFWQR